MTLDDLIGFLRRLNDAGIHYTLGSFRESVNVTVTTPSNERWKSSSSRTVTWRLSASSAREDGRAKLDGIFE
ncbi:MAG TPA: hypothetical protein VH063_12385 [Gaiellaceae bacterium]|nr:hypothetical protein [Gaiellaceae bacterium]